MTTQPQPEQAIPVPAPTDFQRLDAINQASQSIQNPSQTAPTVNPTVPQGIPEPTPLFPGAPQPDTTPVVPQVTQDPYYNPYQPVVDPGPAPAPVTQPTIQQPDPAMQAERQRMASERQALQAQRNQMALQALYQDIVAEAKTNMTRWMGMGVSEENAQKEAARIAERDWQLGGTALQQQVTQSQAQQVAAQYGVNPDDLASVPPQMMEAHARNLQQIQRLSTQVGSVTQAQQVQQRFDSNQSASAGDTFTQLAGRMGNEGQIPSNQDVAAWWQWMGTTGAR